jgi:hypothetical protein
MTLLSICQDVARNTKVKVPNTIIGNSELEAVRLLQAATETVNDLLRRVDWQELEAEATITTVASTEAYSLPSDFERIVNDSAWNVTSKYPMSGVTSAKDWQTLKNSSFSNGSVIDLYRIRGSQFLVYPTPTTVESLIYEYIQNTPVESSGGSAQIGWQADTDLPRIDEFLVELGIKWRFRKSLGKAYQEDQRQYKEIALHKISNDKGRRTITPNFKRKRGSNIAYLQAVTAPS